MILKSGKEYHGDWFEGKFKAKGTRRSTHGGMKVNIFKKNKNNGT